MRTVFPKPTENHLENRHDPGSYTNGSVLEKQIRSQLSSTTGLDMESYGVVYAAVHASMPRPIPIIIKSVCDYADSQKTDDYQKFAAYTSCQFAKLLYEKYLPFE